MRTRWTIEILREPGYAGPPERVVVWDDGDPPPNQSDIVGDVYVTDQAVVIRTGWTPIGGHSYERHVPWHQVRDYRSEQFAKDSR